MLKPICVPCQRFFRCKKTGFYFIEGMPKFNGAPRGTEAPEHWEPYKTWSGDLYECEGCGARIVSGTGRSPISEHFQPDFASVADSLGARQLQVNDC